MCIISFNSSPTLPLKQYEKIVNNVNNSCIRYLSLAFQIGLTTKPIVPLSLRPVSWTFSIILTLYEESLE